MQAALVKASPIPSAAGGPAATTWTAAAAAAAAATPAALEHNPKPIKGMTTCDYGEDVPAPQRWTFTAAGQIKQGHNTCLLAQQPPALGSCGSDASRWDLGRANVTTAQIRTLEATPRCLKFIGGNDGIEATGLFLDTCGTEPPICQQTRCATSTLVNELWYLSRHGQLIASWTIVPIPPLPSSEEAPSVSWPPVQWNPPFCLASAASAHPPTAPPKPSFVHGDPDISQCLQVWSGPLSGNGTVVGLANMCNGTHPIAATWAELGLDLGSDVTCAVRDLYAGKDLPPAKGSISAGVGEHDIAVFRLTCPL